MMISPRALQLEQVSLDNSTWNKGKAYMFSDRDLTITDVRV